MMFSCELICFVSGVVLCKLNEWSSAEHILSRLCHKDSCTHGRLQLAALDQLGDCFAAQVVLTLHITFILQNVLAEKIQKLWDSEDNCYDYLIKL